MVWVGLTGGIATGKSTVGEILKQHGVPVLQADAVAHQALEPASSTYPTIVQLFGSKIIDPHGGLSRRELGKIIFNNSELRKKLEDIIHPYVRAQVARWKQQQQDLGVDLAVYEVPLLFEKQMQKDFDHILVIAASDSIQIQRLMKRHQLNFEEAKARLASQIPIKDKCAGADTVIKNEGTLQELQQHVVDWLKTIKT